MAHRYEQPQPPSPEDSSAFRLIEIRTERLKALVNFVSSFTPAIGATQGYEVEIDSPPGITVARDETLIAAFSAIEALAKKSV